MNKFLIIVSFLFSSLIYGAEVMDFTQKGYMHSLSQKDVVVLEFNASWCSTCKKQHIALNEILGTGKFPQVDIFKVNYDDSEKLKNKFNVQRQSTLILIKNRKFNSRLIGVSDQDDLSAFLEQGVN